MKFKRKLGDSSLTYLDRKKKLERKLGKTLKLEILELLEDLAL